MFVGIINQYLEMFIAVAGVVGIVTTYVVKYTRKRRATEAQRRSDLIDLIREVTKPIQPGTNGGLSMTDLHGKFDEAEKLQSAFRNEVRNDISLLKSAVVTLENEKDGIE
jgi:hypothetical protein